MLPKAAKLPPGPRTPALWQTLSWLLNTTQFLERCAHRYGPIFTARIIGFGTSIMIADSGAAREVFSAGPEVVGVTHSKHFLPLVGPSSLFMLQGEPHRRQRRRLLAVLQRDHIQAQGPLIVELTDAALDSWPLGARFSAHAALRELSLQLILRMVLGAESPARLAALARLLTAGVRIAETPAMLIPLHLQQRLGRWTPWSKIRRLISEMDGLLYQEIAARRARGAGSGGDILSLLLQLPGDGMQGPLTDGELRDQIVTLIVAAHDTTATTLTWALHWLLADPALCVRLQREVRRGEAPLDPEHLAGLPLLDALVRETLRLSPAFPVVGRELKRPLRLLEHELPAGVRVVPCPYLAQRDGQSFAEPLQFRPERFLHQRPRPEQWFPFGGGFARCVGMELALYEMKLILGVILARAALERAPGPPTRPTLRFFSLIPGGGLPVVLRSRSRPPRRAAALGSKPAPDELDLEPLPTLGRCHQIAPDELEEER
ncbi:MAG TPA: cytochrome P450, partial [Pseudomonadota bacterium]|nr:cytochrome P450 [Pseudomonadota bacterium]